MPVPEGFDRSKLDVYAYMVSVPEEILQDEIALDRLHQLMADRVVEMAEASGYVQPYEDFYFGQFGKPVPSYDEDGNPTPLHVLLTVEIPVVPKA